MSLFLLTFFLIYGGVHCYFFVKVRGYLALGPVGGSCLALFLALMVVAPLLVRIAERGGLEAWARVLAYAGYCWMGFLFLFFTAALALDLYRLLVHLLGLLTRADLSLFTLPARSAFLAALSYALVIFAFGYYEALHPRTERIVIESPRIPAAMGRIRVALISDVHLGLIVREERLRRVLNEVRGAAPDMLVSVGDLVDGRVDGLAGLVDALGEIRPRFGKFAVTGNHEYYVGIGQATDFTRRAGFTILDGKRVELAGITVVGVGDPTGYKMGVEPGGREGELLASRPRSGFTILLKHRPSVERESTGLFDLQLSGHVHKGQVFPFGLVTRLFYPVATGYSRLPGGASLYVSRGSGTWGPPIRFLAPPEVTLIELVHGNG